MAFRELVSPSLTELFVKELEGMILSGELVPGQKLPPEREMAKRMKVSLAVVNGGITRLSAKGFLRVVPRKGTFVADYIRDGNISTLESILEYSENYFRSDLLDAIIDLRKTCEGRVLEQACRNRTEAQLETLASLLTAFDQAEDYTEKSEIAFSFHHEVSIASGNMVYPLIFSTFRRVYRSFYYTMFTIQGAGPSRNELQAFWDCIRTQDAVGGQKCLTDFIEHWRHVFYAYYHEGQEYHDLDRGRSQTG